MGGYCTNNEHPKNSDTTMDNEYGQQIIIRQCSEPTDQANRVYEALKYKPRPCPHRKSVIPRLKSKQMKPLKNLLFFLVSLQCGLKICVPFMH